MKRLFLIVISVMLLTVLCSCELSCDPPAQGKIHILVYGNDYAGTDSKLFKTIPDAIEVGNALIMLSEKAGYEYGNTYDITYLVGPSTKYNHLAIKEDDIINDVSKATLLDKLTLMNQSDSFSDSDLTIIYFSCHGKSDYSVNEKVSYFTDTSVHCFLAANETSSYGSKYVLLKLSDLKKQIELIPGTKVVISDFCFSGGFVQSDFVSVTSGEYSGISSTELLEYTNLINESPSVYFLSAARYNQKSYEDKPYHGNFTTALLDGLGWDDISRELIRPAAEKNGCITLFNLYKYTVKHDDEARQTPMTSGGSNDIILFSF